MFAVIKQLIKHGRSAIPTDELLRVPTEDCKLATREQSGSNMSNIEEVQQQLSNRIRKVFGRSLHIRHLDTGSCNLCEWEIIAMTNPIYDISRLGIEFVASPRHADMLLVTGGVTRNLSHVIAKVYDATPNPKLVVAVGDCACGTDHIGKTYANLGGLSEIVPVNAFVPGCPPHPQAILRGILTAIERFEDR